MKPGCGKALRHAACGATANYTPPAGRGPAARPWRLPAWLLWLCATALPAAAQPAEAPCADCVIVRLDAAAARDVLDGGAPVNGLRVLLAPEAREAAARLAAAGAAVWLETAIDRTVPAEALRHASGLVLTGEPAGPGVFAVQQAATAARALRPEIRLVLDPPRDVADGRATGALGPYVDGVLLHETAARDHPLRTYPGMDVWTWAASDDPLLDRSATGAGTVVVTPRDARAVLTTLGAVRGLIPPGLTPLPEVSVSCEGCRSRVWLHPETLDAIALVDGVGAGARVRIAPDALRVTLADPARGRSLPLAPDRNDAATVDLPADVAGRVVLAIGGWRGSDEDVYRAGVEVTARRQLTAAEIIARHQAQRARQAATVDSLITTGTTVLSFEVPGFPAPITITADTTIYTRGALTDVAQTSIRVNGADLAADGRAPRLPLIEPERVSTPPLTIALTDTYTYRLDGRERRAGRDTHVVAFTPVRAAAPGVFGRAWIDTATFALVRMEATQTGLRGPIVSAEQHDEFVPVRAGEREVWLQSRSSSFQIYQAAGLRTPIRREVVTPAHEVNPPDFDARLRARYASRAVMLRDTPEGFRYLVPPDGSGDATTRVVGGDAAPRVVSLAFGVLVDPNITVPLPYAGVSYLDFDFLDRGVQLSGFFGGAYGQLAWTVPGFVRPGWQLTGRLFGIAASYNDRSFREGLERYDENIRQRPFRSAVTVVAPLSPRAQLRLGYDFEYTAFGRGDDTAADFLVPPDARVHALRVGLDVQRGPWNGLAFWSPARRQGWRPWGRGGQAETSASFQRYGVTIARGWVLGPGSVARVEGSWMDGHDLDRFSRYTFDSLEQRLRGYPSAGLRYDRGAIVRTLATWAPRPRLRLDGFADYAAVRDPGFGDGLRSYPGVGAAVELALPRRLLVGVEWGYGFEARNTDGSRGTHVVRVSGVKLF